MLFGECKYSSSPKGVEVLHELRRKAKYVPWKTQTRKELFVLYSRSGFTDELRQMAEDDHSVILAE